MTPFSLVHDFDADLPTYWKLFFDEAYNVALYQRIKVKERTVISSKDTGPTIDRVIKIVPERDLPGFIKKLVGGDFGYTETSVLHKDRNTMDVKIEPTMMRDRTKMSGVYKVEAIGDKKVRRTFAGSITVEIPLVGRKVEEFVIADLTQAYQTATDVTREWLARGA